MRTLAFWPGVHVGDGRLVDLGLEHHLREVGDLHDHRAGVVHRAGHDDLADLGVEAGDDAVDGRE